MTALRRSLLEALVVGEVNVCVERSGTRRGERRSMLLSRCGPQRHPSSNGAEMVCVRAPELECVCKDSLSMSARPDSEASLSTALKLASQGPGRGRPAPVPASRDWVGVAAGCGAAATALGGTASVSLGARGGPAGGSVGVSCAGRTAWQWALGPRCAPGTVAWAAGRRPSSAAALGARPECGPRAPCARCLRRGPGRP